MRIFKNNSGILVSEIRETIGENMERILWHVEVEIQLRHPNCQTE